MNVHREAPAPENKSNIKQKARTLTDDVGELFELYYRLAIVTATEKASNAAAVSITFMMILFLGMFTLLFAGLGLGWYLGSVLDSIFAGYAIVSGVFLALITATIIFRKTHIFPFIRNTIIKRVYES